MGFRISLYRVPNEIVDKYRGFTEEDYETDDKGVMLDELEKECIKYDTLTDVIMSDRNENFSTRLFKNKLEIESDMYFGTISQQQLLNIIEDVRVNHIIKWFDGRRVDKDKLGDYWTKHHFFFVEMGNGLLMKQKMQIKENGTSRLTIGNISGKTITVHHHS